MNLSMFMQLGKFHFFTMSERTLSYWTDNVWAKSCKLRKWESKCGALKMDVCVGWLVNETLYDVIKL
jgi:hypothetical protein